MLLHTLTAIIYIKKILFDQSESSIPERYASNNELGLLFCIVCILWHSNIVNVQELID